MQDIFLFAEIDRVAGVVAALVADHGVEGRAEQIDDLALAFVAPLEADNGGMGRRVRCCVQRSAVVGVRLQARSLARPRRCLGGSVDRSQAAGLC